MPAAGTAHTTAVMAVRGWRSDIETTWIGSDLNPHSLSAQTAAIPIVDNVVRAVPNVTNHARELAGAESSTLAALVDEFDPDAALDAAEAAIRGGDFERATSE